MTAPQESIGRREAIARQREVALVDLVDRLLAGGVVLGGDLTLSIADVDLVYVGLRALITSVATAEEKGLGLPSARGEPSGPAWGDSLGPARGDPFG
jgi:hypothetical protein